MTAFDEFWEAYPKKVAKKAAHEKYDRIIQKKIATHEQIMAGLDLYKRTKEDWRDWLHPTTWLHGQRWDDEPAKPNASSNKHRVKPTPQYLRTKRERVKVTPEEKAKREARERYHAWLKGQGIDWRVMPLEDYRKGFADRLSQDTANA